MLCRSAWLLFGLLVSAQAQVLEGAFEGEFIGDTSGAKAASLLVPTCKIAFKIRICGHVEGDRFNGQYAAVFNPSIATFDVESVAKEIVDWNVKYQQKLLCSGQVTGIVVLPPGTRLPERAPEGKELPPRNKRQQRYLRRMAAALAKAMDKWKDGASVDCAKLNQSVGEITPGGLKSSAPLSADEIARNAMAGQVLNDAEEKAYKASAEVIANAFNDYVDNYTGEIVFPNGAAFPGPQMPPTPNSPAVVSSGRSSASGGLSQEALEKAFGDNAESKGIDSDTFDLLVQSFDKSLSDFEASNQIMNAMGQGPVPTYDPEKRPVGPVQGGSATGGKLVGSKFPVDEFKDRDRDLRPPTAGPDGRQMPKEPKSSHPRITLKFHGMPESIAVSLREVVKHGKSRINLAEEAQLGLGFFAPQAKIYRPTFEVPYRNGIFSGRINADVAKPSPMQDGFLREIAKSTLTLEPKLPKRVPRELGLNEEGEPPKTPDGYKAPDNQEYPAFGFLENNVMVKRGGTPQDAKRPSQGVQAAPSQQKVLVSGSSASIFAPSLPAAGLYASVSAPVQTASGFTGTDRTYIPMQKSATFSVESGRPVQVIIPSSPWTRRTYSCTPSSKTTMQLKDGKLMATPTLRFSITEDFDGHHKQRPVDLEPKPRPASTKGDLANALKGFGWGMKKKQTMAGKPDLGAPKWCPDRLGFPSDFSWSRRNKGNDFVKRSGGIEVDYFRIEGKTDQTLARCRDSFSKALLADNWTGAWKENKATFTRREMFAQIDLSIKKERSYVKFNIERDKDYQKLQKPASAKTEPASADPKSVAPTVVTHLVAAGQIQGTDDLWLDADESQGKIRVQFRVPGGGHWELSFRTSDIKWADSTGTIIVHMGQAELGRKSTVNQNQAYTIPLKGRLPDSCTLELSIDSTNGAAIRRDSIRLIQTTPKTVGKAGPVPKTTPASDTQTEAVKAADGKLTPDAYAQMTGQVILTMAPMVKTMRTEMAKVDGDKKILIAMGHGEKIQEAVDAVYKKYGVDQAWVKKVQKNPALEKAVAEYIKQNPEVDAAMKEMQKR